MKYNIEMSEGCTAFYTLVNDKNINDMSEQERDEFVDYLLAEIKQRVKENNVSIDRIIQLLEYDRYETDKYNCEQCGDVTTRTYWNI